MMIYYVVVFSDCLWFMSGLCMGTASSTLSDSNRAGHVRPVPAVVVHFSGWEWSMGFN